MCVQKYILHRNDPRGEWSRVASRRTGGRYHLRILLRSSVSPRGETTLQASSTGVRCRPWIRHGSTAGYSRRQDRLLYTAGSISFAMLLGWGLGRLLIVKQGTSFLITAGTAICGGSAIA